MKDQPKSDFNGAAVMLLPSEGDQRDVARFGKIKAAEMHTTVLYLGDKASDLPCTPEEAALALEQIVQDYTRLPGSLGPSERFDAAGDHPVVVKVNAERLLQLRKDVIAALKPLGLKDASTYDFNPHLTLGYVNHGEPNPVPDFKTMDVWFDRLRLGWNGKHFDIYLNEGAAVEQTKTLRDPETGKFANLRTRLRQQTEALVRDRESALNPSPSSSDTADAGDSADVPTGAAGEGEGEAKALWNDLPNCKCCGGKGEHPKIGAECYTCDAGGSTDEGTGLCINNEKHPDFKKHIHEDYGMQECDGCGEFYLADHPEGKLHDHWTTGTKDVHSGMVGNHNTSRRTVLSTRRIVKRRMRNTPFELRLKSLLEDAEEKTAKFPASDFHAASDGQKCSRWGCKRPAVKSRTVGGKELGACAQHAAEMTEQKDPFVKCSDCGKVYGISHMDMREVREHKKKCKGKKEKKVARDGDGDGFIYDGTARMRPAPVGTPVIGKLTYAGKSEWEGMQKVKDSHGITYHVGPDGAGDFAAFGDPSGDDPWEDTAVQYARSHIEALQLLDAITRDQRKVGTKPVNGSNAKNPTKINIPKTGVQPKKATAARARKAATTKKTTTTRKTAASRAPSLAKLLSESGGDMEPEQKRGVELVGKLETAPPKTSRRTGVVKKATRQKRTNPEDYHFRGDKPVQTEALRIKAHLRAGGSERAVELAKERGVPFKLAPARDNEHLWFPKDPNSDIAFSFRQQKPLLDKDGAQVYKTVRGKKVPQFVPGEFGPRIAVQTKEAAERNKANKDSKVLGMAANMHKLDAALEKDARRNPHAAAVFLMRTLGIRPNTMSEEAQERNLSKKSPLKARGLRARGIDPDQPIYGATSLQARHVRFEGNAAIIDFIGKEHVRNTHYIEDPDIIDVLRTWKRGKSGNQRLFDGVTADTTKNYIQQHLGSGITNKDLRAYLATDLAAMLKKAYGSRPSTKKEFDLAQAEIARVVAKTLNNAAKQSRDSYIASGVWDDWKRGLPE